MKKCYKCKQKKESRQIAAHVEGKGDVCWTCCNKGKTFMAKKINKSDLPITQGYAFARRIRITFRGKRMDFDSIAAAAEGVGASQYLIRRAALGTPPVRPEFKGLRAEFIQKGA